MLLDGESAGRPTGLMSTPTGMARLCGSGCISLFVRPDRSATGGLRSSFSMTAPKSSASRLDKAADRARFLGIDAKYPAVDQLVKGVKLVDHAGPPAWRRQDFEERMVGVHHPPQTPRHLPMLVTPGITLCGMNKPRIFLGRRESRRN